MIGKLTMSDQIVECVLSEIIDQVQFLNDCQCEIVEDYIDINPEKGMTIKYCIFCEKTYP